VSGRRQCNSGATPRAVIGVCSDIPARSEAIVVAHSPVFLPTLRPAAKQLPCGALSKREREKAGADKTSCFTHDKPVPEGTALVRIITAFWVCLSAWQPEACKALQRRPAELRQHPLQLVSPRRAAQGACLEGPSPQLPQDVQPARRTPPAAERQPRHRNEGACVQLHHGWKRRGRALPGGRQQQPAERRMPPQRGWVSIHHQGPRIRQIQVMSAARR
jgi:hypothetical protein